jgi:hypothetical protein
MLATMAKRRVRMGAVAVCRGTGRGVCLEIIPMPPNTRVQG